MSVFRRSRHPLVRWWWEMDRGTVFLLLALMFAGGVAVTTASVAVAKTYQVGPYYFAIKQSIFLATGLVVMVALTLLHPVGVKRIGWLLMALAFGGVLLTLFVGVDVKGASRWISIAGQTIQPSEFLKPAFIIVNATLLARANSAQLRQGFVFSLGLMALVGLPLLLQPDFGMFLLLGLVWFAQVFMAGVPVLFLIPLVLSGLGAIMGAYFALPHVRDRIARFMDPGSSDTYQVDQASEAILSGHLFGRGVGEGVVKHTLPDAHTDFIFAVVAEEFGIIVCLLLLGAYVTLVLRGFNRVMLQQDRFVLLAGGGILCLLAIQVMVNIGVALHLLPTTGMTLPFISYGGSATLSMALMMGFLLALLRKRRSLPR